MTTLSIYPKFGDKTAKITGTVSAGEHVDVRIIGGASLLPSSTLRLRITCGKTIAVFPQPESNDVWATEGSDLKCHLNLNTVQAEIALRHGCVSCHALLEQTADDEHTLEPTLFFDDEFEVLPWRKIPGETTPLNLDAYPDVIASFERRLNEFGAVVTHTRELVAQAKGAAVGANNRAENAERSAQEAEKSALAAQRSLDGINSQVADARNAAVQAMSSASAASDSAAAAEEKADVAAEKAGEAADSASEAVEKVDSHTERTDNPHNVTKAQVGLENVDNTADVDKPVSSSQRAAIDAVETAARTAVQNEKSRADLVERNLRTDLTREINRATNTEAGLESSKQNKLSSQQIVAVNSGIDATKVAKILQNEIAISSESVRARTEEARLQAAINAIKTFEVVVADSLPDPSEEYNKKLYLIPSANPETRNVRDEFICVKVDDVWMWEQVGSTAITIEFDEEPTEGSQKAARSGGIWSWVKRLITGRLFRKTLPKYLYELSFDDVYIEDARVWYAQHDHEPASAACSAVRKGNLLGRNYDYPYDEMAEFIVKVSAKVGRHASVGTANVRTDLTENIVCSGEFSPLYRALPGRVVDGINDAGVVAEVNIIPRDTTKDPEYEEGVRELHPFEVVRHVLDNFDNAADAAAYIAAHYYIPEGSPDSYHWMIADANETYIVEDGDVIDTATKMTNHRAGTDAYGAGYSRDAILEGSGTVAELLDAVKYTNAYANGWPWPDEFAGMTDSQGKIPHDATDRLRAWANTYVAPLLDESRKPAARGNGCWQTVHSAIYDISAKTLSIAVQEDFSKRYVFAVDKAGTITEDIEELKKRGYFAIDEQGNIYAVIPDQN